MKKYIYLKQRDFLQAGDEYQIIHGLKIYQPVPEKYYGQRKNKFVNRTARVRRVID